MIVKKRWGLSVILAAGPCVILAAACALPKPHVPHPQRKSPSLSAFASSIRPLLQKYCLGCHATGVKKGSLDLQRFRSDTDIRRDLKPWQGVVDHLEIGDMPPNGSPQPSEAEKKRIVAWTKALLAVEAKVHSGDPGFVPLRRLSNAEYNCTIRDLTGVDLQPAREFPVDGAAGEGFTNAAEGLTDISPILLTKYFNSAKEIAQHAVLLPDGYRFSSGKTRRDWTDESTAKLRAYYGQFTGAEGKLEYAPYLAATIRHRADLSAGKSTISAVASKEKLNTKYLTILWQALNDQRPSYPLAEIRSAWGKATEKDVPALVAQVTDWQNSLWQTVRVGSYVRPVGNGFAESTSRQLAVDPKVSETQTLRLAVKPIPGQNAVVIHLASHEMGAFPAGKVIWQNPRFEGAGKPPLALKDYPRYGAGYEAEYAAVFDSTKLCLTAAAAAINQPEKSVDTLAREYRVDPDLLKRWIMLLNLSPITRDAVLDFPGRPVALAGLDRLTDRHEGQGGQKAISGWQVGAGLPAVFSNASDILEHIPGDAAPHSVVVHPTPTEFVGITWTAPVAGRFRISAQINHAHPACGNGAAWWLEQRRGDRATMFAEGAIPLGGSAAPEDKTLRIEKGDTLLFAIDAKNGDHGCDLTRIAWRLTEQDNGRVWDLASDVADSILAGNPHPDRFGNAAVWSFVKGPTRPVSAGTPKMIPAHSVLDAWRKVAVDPTHAAEAEALAEVASALLTAPRPDRLPLDDPNRKLYDSLVVADGPLLLGLDLAQYAKPSTTFGLPAERFNSDGSLVGSGNEEIEFRMPVALMTGREFVVDAKLDAQNPDRAVLFQVNANRTGVEVRWDGKSPIVASSSGAGFKKFVDGINQFRNCFPLYLCFPNVIPNDEVVSLKMFHREDEPLKRLFLNDEQARTLDRLWAEHKFISRQAVAENKYLPLFIGFVTQDQPKEMVAYFEGQRPAFQKRADDFEKQEDAAIPAQLKALRDFTSRAYRRPLTAKETAEQVGLYKSLRAKGVAHEETIRCVLARVLVAPSFLFRIEQAPAGTLAGSVNDWELASRLSYFLWSSEPDAELRRLAATGKLRDSQVLVAQTRRMLQDDRLRALATEFGAQWVHVRGFDELSEKNERLFPTFDAGLRKAINEETIQFFLDLFHSDRPVNRLLDADYVFVNQTLAKHYAIPGVTGSEWRRVENARKYGRGGILALASVQAKVSGASRTSPVLRGNWIVETLLGEKMPRPPAIVPKLPEEEGRGNLTIKQQVEKHSKIPECAVCHRRMDPYGFALERYDPIGRLRDKDLGGLPVDCKAKLKDGTEFEGIDGLRSYLMTKKRDIIVRLFCRRLLGYALGRSVANSDLPLIDRMMLELDRNGGRISAAVMTIVRSPQFRKIRGRDYADSR